MRHLVLILFLIFNPISLFSQSSNDTTTIILEEVVVTEVIKPPINGTICYSENERRKRRGCSITLSLKNNIQLYSVITHQNHSEFGLPMYPFRFENVNQMANTVAGVLSMDGERPSILGARREGTAYYLNEVRILEGFLPNTVY